MSQPSANPATRSPTSAAAEPRLRRWLWALGYFAFFFAAMGLGGVLFLLGGIALILVPGSLPTWAEVGYVLVGIAGTVGIGVLATNGAFHRRVGSLPPTAQGVAATAQARAVRWLASLTGAIVIAVIAGAARVLVVKLLE